MGDHCLLGMGAGSVRGSKGMTEREGFTSEGFERSSRSSDLEAQVKTHGSQGKAGLGKMDGTSRMEKTVCT